MFSKKIACFPIFDDSWWTLSWGERSSRSLCDFLETCRRRSLVHDLLLSCTCDSSPTNPPMHELRFVVGYLLVDQYSLLTPFGSCHSPLFLIGRFAAHGFSYLPPSDQIGFFFFFFSVLVLPYHKLPLSDHIGLLNTSSLCPNVSIWIFFNDCVCCDFYSFFYGVSLVMGLGISTTSHPL